MLTQPDFRLYVTFVGRHLGHPEHSRFIPGMRPDCFRNTNPGIGRHRRR
jgi:hypothetical protein